MKQPKKPGISPTKDRTPPNPSLVIKSKLTELQQDLLVITFFVVVVIALHSPLFLNKQLYDGGDSHEAIVKTAMINKYYDQTGEVPRWNPYPEGGIPNVFFLPKAIFSPDFYIGKMGDIIGIPIVYLLIGVIGMYYLLKFLRFPLLLSVIVSLCFILAPYYRSLIIVGQYMPTKFEAVMIIPWMLLFFLSFLERMKLLHLLMFSFFFALQLLTQHYQVIYYTGLLLLAAGIYPMIRLLRQKEIKKFFIQYGALVLAAGFSILLTAYPLFVSKKYNDASIRSTWGIDISKPANVIQKGSGVDTAFIGQWSPAGRELTDLFVPAASGGSSKEKYEGQSAPELSGNELPAYWGKMTFSFSYSYFGIPILLALAGLFFYRRDPLVLSLGLVGLLLTLWSLGTTIHGFYIFFYKWLPFFKNFRTPPTSLTVVYFIVSVLAAYGLRFLFQDLPAVASVFRKKVFFTIAAFFAFGLLFYVIGDSVSYSKAGENYETNYSALLLKARKELYGDDMRRYFLLAALLSAIIAGYLFRLFKKQVAFVLVGLLMITDLVLINNRYTNALLDGEEMVARYLPVKPLSDFFRADKEIYRVFPVTDRGRDLSAVVPIIGDHDLQVLTTVYEINTNNLYQNVDGLFNINWNVLKIFGVKYFVCDREIIHPQLTLKYSDPVTKDFVYQFNGYRSFGHFVKNNIVISSGYERLKMINNPAFDASQTAILQKGLPTSVAAPDSSSISVTLFTPNELTYELYTGKQALFVMPLPYVNDGWSVFIDDKQVKDIYIANHATQAFVVPAGQHRVRAVFNTASYKSSYWVSAICWILFYIAIALLWWKGRRGRLVKAEA